MTERFEKFSSSLFSMIRIVQQLESKEMENYGLKGSFAQYLLVLRRNPKGVTAAEIAKSCDKDKAAVSRAVKEMQEKGILRRNEENGNYRSALLLTETGRKAADYVHQKATRAVEAASVGIRDEDRQVMYDTLNKIAENLNRIYKEGF